MLHEVNVKDSFADIPTEFLSISYFPSEAINISSMEFLDFPNKILYILLSNPRGVCIHFFNPQRELRSHLRSEDCSEGLIVLKRGLE